MNKVKLEPKYNHTIQQGTSSGWGENIRNHVRAQYLDSEMAIWVFENVKGRFIIDDGHIFFENDEDAMAFKLRWL